MEYVMGLGCDVEFVMSIVLRSCVVVVMEGV